MSRPNGSTTFTKLNKAQTELLFGALPNFELLVSTKQLKELAENTGMEIAEIQPQAPTVPRETGNALAVPMPTSEENQLANPVPTPLRFSVE